MADTVARIPFSRQDEQTIGSMARWMRFMAVVGIVGGIFMLILLLLGVGLVAAGSELGQTSPKWGELRRFFEETGTLLYFLLAVVLLAAVASLWQNFALYHAGDYFDRVAKTDIADLDYLQHGLDKLRVYFKVQVMVMVVSVAVAVGTGLAIVAVLRHAQ